MTSRAVTTPTGNYQTRAARRDDIEQLVDLCREHAQFERAGYDVSDKTRKLETALFDSPARLHAWVAVGKDALIGYASVTVDFSTWSAREFVHMDCLFVREDWRGARIGSALLDCVAGFARARGCAEVQWQTPHWNTDAARFYRQSGATSSEKRRFSLQIAPVGIQSGLV